MSKLEEENNSFLFLEKNTLHMLMEYLLLNDGQRMDAELIKKLDQMIVEQKKEFEEVILLIREKMY